jgi:cysteinyl-tRNA synthetase
VGLKLYNTLTREKDTFEPIDPANVRMYVCGPTVYQRIHIGNARPLIVFDVLFRLLRHLYGERHVTYVRNITDIDDKIIAQAEKNGEPIEALTKRTTADFLADADALGCLRPTHEPKATEHIPEMLAMIAKLIEQGHAYAADGHVLFHVPSMPAYGRLSGRNRDDQIAGARVEVAPYKRDPADFVLWKPSTPEQPGWDSPWGRGRPGWHIECSAMSERWLGAPFDIHGGGLDLIFPHHENEIAQSCCVHKLDRMANYWMHNGFVEMSGEKMAKSVGNVLRLEEAFKIVGGRRYGDAIRLWMLGTHYRQPIDCSEGELRRARKKLDQYHIAFRKLDSIPLMPKPVDQDVLNALEDDFNAPQALARLESMRSQMNTYLEHGNKFEAADMASQLKATGACLGLLAAPSQLWLQGDVSESEVRIRQLISDRAAARRRGDFATADQIRDRLVSDGYLLEDTPTGTTWRRA